MFAQMKAQSIKKKFTLLQVKKLFRINCSNFLPNPQVKAGGQEFVAREEEVARGQAVVEEKLLEEKVEEGQVEQSD